MAEAVSKGPWDAIKTAVSYVKAKTVEKWTKPIVERMIKFVAHINM